MAAVASLLDHGDAPGHGSAAQEVEDALTALVDLVRGDLEACNRVIVARMDSPVALIPQLAA
ncbi:MAG TPA: hypothetical protein VHB27_16445, partial [Rhodopila sp.]|nr:hypothetical protein [Rhodopila sp.]